MRSFSPANKKAPSKNEEAFIYPAEKPHLIPLDGDEK
jgi:hypothetical protein